MFSLLPPTVQDAKDTVVKSFEVYPIPVIDAGTNVQICKGARTQLAASGGATYIWSPATGLSCTNCANPFATPLLTQKYLVTGSSVYGCKNIDSLNITVIQPFVMNNKNDDTICVGSSVRLFASGANSYEWSPSSGLSNISSSIPTASPRTTTTYRVIGSDAYGCFKDTGYTTIKVYPIPQVDAGKDVTIKNGGQAIVLTPTLSPDVTWTYWLPAPGIISYTVPNLTVKPKDPTDRRSSTIWCAARSSSTTPRSKTSCCCAATARRCSCSPMWSTTSRCASRTSFVPRSICPTPPSSNCCGRRWGSSRRSGRTCHCSSTSSARSCRSAATRLQSSSTAPRATWPRR